MDATGRSEELLVLACEHLAFLVGRISKRKRKFKKSSPESL